MGANPFNLAIRFLLELSALLAMGLWGWQQSEDWLRFVLASCIPVIAAIVWGTLAVPEDPSRSGKAPIPVPGLVRLIIELAFFAIGAWMFSQTGYPLITLIFSSVVVVHYLLSYDRVGWLIKQNR